MNSSVGQIICLPVFHVILITVISKLLFLSDFNKHTVKAEHQDLFKHLSCLAAFDTSKQRECGLFILFGECVFVAFFS